MAKGPPLTGLGIVLTEGDAQLIDINLFPQFARQLCKVGDLMLAKDSASIGDAAYLRERSMASRISIQ